MLDIITRRRLQEVKLKVHRKQFQAQYPHHSMDLFLEEPTGHSEVNADHLLALLRNPISDEVNTEITTLCFLLFSLTL